MREGKRNQRGVGIALSLMLALMMTQLFCFSSMAEELYEIRMQLPFTQSGMKEVEEAANALLEPDLKVSLSFVPSHDPTFDA
ncbi:MAG: hypothetical protein IIZ39_05745, partial [Blautia sp.]|nr:hypothetical protein [Blautia sp.]